MFFPRDKHLHKLATDYAAARLRDEVNFTDYTKVIVVCEVDEAGAPLRATGLMCGVPRFDFPVVRFDDDRSAEKLFDRMRGYLEDRQQRGQEAFVHLADREPRESRCPHWRKWLRKVGAVKASRWLVRI